MQTYDRVKLTGPCPHGCGIELDNPDKLPASALEERPYALFVHAKAVATVTCPQCGGVIVTRPAGPGAVTLEALG